jgi:predicted nucleic acid-binding protein
MICVDTSSLIAFWQGEQSPDTALVDQAFADKTIRLSPVTVSEILSSPGIPSSMEDDLGAIPLLEITDGYWQRAGKLRARLLRRGYRPKIADTLIAQSCLDHRAPLITRDADFAAFEKIAGLRLL